MNDQDQENPMSSILGNMAIAHEMIMSDNFQLKSMSDDDAAQNSLEKHVHDIMHQAFWDLLEKDLAEDPPVYANALELLKEMKMLILEVARSDNNPISAQVKEGFDLDFIMQEINNEAFDLCKFAQFVLDILSKLCAPIRDERITELRDVVDVVPLLRGVFELINLMKLDMANYEIKTIKPVLMQQAVEYEKQKFAEYLKEKPDGLTITTSWLRKAYERIQTLKKSDSPIKITPSLIITNAFLELLELREDTNYPETLSMDVVRLQDIAITLTQLTNLSTLLTISLNFLGPHFSTDQSFVKRLKFAITVLIGDALELNDDLLQSVYLQIIDESEKESEKKELNKKNDEEKLILKQQIMEASKKGHHLRDLIKSRIRDYVLLSMTSQKQGSPLSTVLLPIQSVLKDTTLKFLRVIQHNRNVYATYYTDIVTTFLTEDEQS